MSSADRVIGILGLFTLERRVWTAEAIAKHFDVSTSQAYRYCQSLVKAGFLDPLLPAGYTLGPAIVELERVVQLSDPLISVARPVMTSLVPFVPAGATLLVSKLYRSRVICMAQVLSRGPQNIISFERGRPMPLLWGATSKVILAHMTKRELTRIYQAKETVAPAGAKRRPSLEVLKKELTQIRRAGYCVAHGEIDPGRVAVAAPILTEQRVVMGSLTIAIPEEAADPRTVRRLSTLMMASATEIEESVIEQVRAETEKTRSTTPTSARRNAKAYGR